MDTNQNRPQESATNVGSGNVSPFSMIKPLVIAVSGVLAGSAAWAGPYVNVENNAGFTGSDFGGSVTDMHVGYEGGDDVYGFYIQGWSCFTPSLTVMLVSLSCLAKLAAAFKPLSSLVPFMAKSAL